MPSTAPPLSSRLARAAIAAVLSALAPGLAAQETQGRAAPADDPGMVVARTINPRIAYRGIPTAENPVHTEATLFPARTFHAAMDGTVGELLGDEALGARGSAGLHAGAATEAAMRRVLTGDASPLGPALGTGAAARGPGAAMGGAVGRAVGAGTGFGGLVGALPGITPAQQGGGP